MATETLRPNAAGAECNIPEEIGDACPNHYLNVDEETSDEDTTVVSCWHRDDYYRDLYNIADSGVGAGTINSVKVYAHCRCDATPNQASMKIAIRSDTTVTEDTARTMTNSYVYYSKQWNTNPADSQAWEWADIDALQIGVAIRSPKSTAGENTYCTQLYVEVDYAAQTEPAVTAQAVTDKEDTTATGNGNITDDGNGTCDARGFVWDLASKGAPGNVAPGASGYANDVPEANGFGTGAFTGSLTGLPTGDTIYVRAYVHNGWGYAYSDEVSFLTKPAAPANVAATDGAHTDKVVVTWTKSTGATGYKVYEGENLLDTLGDVATFDDTGAAAGTIDNAGTAAATDGGTSYVTLSLAGESVANGASRTYKVIALNATGDSDASGTDTGYRTPSAITYQWQISAADSDADYSNISGATTDPYNYAIAHTAGRYYKCVCSATGAPNSPQNSAVDRGWRKHLPVTDGDLMGIGIIRKT